MKGEGEKQCLIEKTSFPKIGYKNIKFDDNSLFLVTGGAGFIGSNLCETISNLGYKVRCLDDLFTGKQENIDLLVSNPNYDFMKGDIKNIQD